MTKTPIYPALKRVFDVTFSLTALFLMVPLLTLIALAIKLTSRGPVLIVKRRVGRGGHVILLANFRIMYVDALTVPSHVAHAAKDDPRITKVGAFLQRTSLDLLPQFYNVLKGDLSVIGPKPLFEFELNHLKPYQLERLVVRPGITGFWQLYGRRRKQFKFDEMIKMDMEYIHNQSFSLDFKILLGTVVTGFRGASAY